MKGSIPVKKWSFQIYLNFHLSHIVYKFVCSCCNATYYGQTQRHFFVISFLTFFSGHLGITRLTGKFVKARKKSTIFDHMLLDGHKASFDNFSIHLKESNGFKLQLKEPLLIWRVNPSSTKIFTHSPWDCLNAYNNVNWYLLFYMWYVILCKYIIIVKNCNHGEIITVW